MYLSQAHRRFPMPDFDILGERVAVRLSGLRGGSYARVMDLRGDLDLKSVMDLDRVAKNRYVPDRRLKALVRRGLVEMIGDLPCIASGAGQEVASAYTSGTDQDAVMGLIRSKGYVTRSDVAEVLASRDGEGAHRGAAQGEGHEPSPDHEEGGDGPQGGRKHKVREVHSLGPLSQ